ncbi:MAG TPA: ATP-binding protein [Fibrobacteria bacterium]|nr:ATP-binding protein [Fibrobacteria bacterium]
MPGLRPKLIIAFTGLSLLLVTVAGLGTVVIERVSRSFDRIFRENLTSIDASQGMGRAAETMNQALLESLWGNTDPDTASVRAEIDAFDRRLEFQRGNVTVLGEKEATDSLQKAWNGFLARYASIPSSGRPIAERRTYYLKEVRPDFESIRRLTGSIADLNSRNILSADGQVRAEARAARKAMTLLLGSGAVLVLIFFYLLGKAILEPLRALTRSAQEIERGNLALALEVRSRDELGQLAEAFNAMTARLREFRRTDQAKLMRTQQTTQMAIDSLPDAVAVISAEGTVEMSNDPAQSLFGIKPGTRVETLGLDWLTALFRNVVRQMRAFNPEGYQSAIQAFPEGKERFFLPHLIPILDRAKLLNGMTLVLADVTELRKLDESKSDLLATVSHELKTRLTSVRMAVHLLLDEKVGDLNPRQADLLVTAREDTERLHRIIEGLLDIGRIRSGNLKMKVRPMEALELVLQPVDSLRHAFQDKGVKLEYDVPAESPRVSADPSRVHLILANLLTNALKYTPAGGRVDVRVSERPGAVAFRVADTGAGIPAGDVPRVFEKFYRGTREGEPGGAGLGLAIAKEVVEAHGGEISVESVEGKGTVFTFTLKPAGDNQGD